MADAEEAHTGCGEFDCLPEPLPTLRHSTSHVMAQAVKRLFPEVKVAIGPAIEDGFYYDFLKATPFTPEDLARIEQVMREIVKADYPFTREEMPRERAIAFFEERGEPFKVEILRGIEAPTVSIYRQGDFLDLCRGPHVRRRVNQGLQLLSSGACWRGGGANHALAHLQDGLAQGISTLPLALMRPKRDHRKLGRELDLFDFYDVAPGAPFWLPHGMILVRELEKFARERLDAQDYQEISTPMLVNKKLWEQSGTGTSTATTCSRWRWKRRSSASSP
jgi:threonyl-tRNA synthetase